VRRSGSAASLLHHGPKATQRIRLRLYEHPNEHCTSLAFADDDTLVFEREVCYFFGRGHPEPLEDGLGS